MAYIDREALIKKIFPYNVVDKKCYSINAKAIYEEIKNAPTADVVPRSEVEELQKKLNDYKKFVGEIRVTGENHAVIIDTEHTEYIDKRVAEGFRNLAVKQAKQEVAREVFAILKSVKVKWIEDNFYRLDGYELDVVEAMFNKDLDLAELEKKYIGE